MPVSLHCFCTCKSLASSLSENLGTFPDLSISSVLHRSSFPLSLVNFIFDSLSPSCFLLVDLHAAGTFCTAFLAILDDRRSLTCCHAKYFPKNSKISTTQVLRCSPGGRPVVKPVMDRHLDPLGHLWVPLSALDIPVQVPPCPADHIWHVGQSHVDICPV